MPTPELVMHESLKTNNVSQPTQGNFPVRSNVLTSIAARQNCLMKEARPTALNPEGDQKIILNPSAIESESALRWTIGSGSHIRCTFHLGIPTSLIQIAATVSMNK